MASEVPVGGKEDMTTYKEGKTCILVWTVAVLALHAMSKARAKKNFAVGLKLRSEEDGRLVVAEQFVGNNKGCRRPDVVRLALDVGSGGGALVVGREDRFDSPDLLVDWVEVWVTVEEGVGDGVDINAVDGKGRWLR